MRSLGEFYSGPTGCMCPLGHGMLTIVLEPQNAMQYNSTRRDMDTIWQSKKSETP